MNLLFNYTLRGFLLFVIIPHLSCAAPNNVKYIKNPPDSSAILETIAFGSCNKTHLSQTYWTSIQENNPDLWIWLGDIIYADTNDMNRMQDMYNAQKNVPEYAQFVEKTPIVGIWDDHDYGQNDGGKHFEVKADAQQLLLDFLDVPKKAEVRKTGGIYQSYMIGQGDKTIKFILLDTRYFRDDLQPNPTRSPRYIINETGDILGEQQWKWLEQELEKSTATFNIICSSIQVLPEEQMFEKWANFPIARQRLLALIAKTQPKNPIILSGDRHIAEVSKIKIDGLEKPLYEVTSSGLTHAYTNANAKSEPNQYRIGELINVRHFAVLKIDWEAVKLTAEIKSIDNEVLQTIDLE